MRARIGAALVAGMSLAAGCAYDPTVLDAGYTLTYEVPAVRVMQPQGPQFNQGLRTGYLDLASAMGGDHADKWHFQFKAVDSAKGQRVLPDAVESRWLAADRSEELAAARARLLAALDQSGRDKAPEPAARAQVAFDCWLEQAVWNAEGELTCKQQFETAIAEVERALATEGEAYLVFFAWDQADLTPVTQTVLDQVAADYQRGRPTRVTIAGHADRSGTEAYNAELSEQRARNVARALVARGVPQSALDVQWFGESQPRIATPDGAREPQNRRVEIVFGDRPSV
ncbi:MAG TPA: OmpA family protein [Geminicoccaceae bacterium]|jgi:outer membrane protein OmpA-like peptidoglycan-associated protein|nr:OmpA family protein [Geminicoccaceae bacterium]